MPISNRNPLTIVKSFRDNITSRTDITNFTSDSKIRVVVDSITDEILSLREEQIAALNEDKISSASGKALDQIGERLNLPRVKSEFARVDYTEQSLAFYVESGTFGDINGGSSIALTNQVIVQSDPNSNELNTAVSYQLTQPYTLQAGESMRYVTARALSIGAASNVGAGVLRRHNFTNYLDSAGKSLKVVNFYPVLNGVNDEGDDQYRFRLANHYNRLIQNNETRMKLLGLETPGVVNSRVEPSYFGIGTAAVFALGPENQSNPALINTLQQRLDDWKLPGGLYMATPATEVKFDFELELTTSQSLSIAQANRLKAELNKGFLYYFRTLTLGSAVDLSVLANTVQKRINTTAVLVQRGGDKVFKRVYIRKGYAGGSPDEKSRLVGLVYQLNADEFASLGTLDIELN